MTAWGCLKKNKRPWGNEYWFRIASEDSNNNDVIVLLENIERVVIDTKSEERGLKRYVFLNWNQNFVLCVEQNCNAE